MRIAHVMAGAPNGGAELFFERLALAQAADGKTILPIIRQDAGRAGRLKALAPVQLGFGGRLDWLTRPRLRAALRRFEPQVVVAWMSRAAEAAPSGSWTLAGRLGGYYDLRYYRNCRHLIGNTRGIVGWIRDQGWATDRVHYLPNFAPDFKKDLPGALPAMLPTPPGAPVLLALGRLHRNKAFDVLIRALPLLPGVHAVIAGEGPERPALEALARRLEVTGRVHLLGWRTDQASLLAAASMLICPSRHEPLGNVIIEAFAAGVPVIAADASGPVELITPGRDGLLVPKEDAGALAGQIRVLLEDPHLAQGLGTAGRARYEATFAPTPVLARWHTVLEGMA